MFEKIKNIHEIATEVERGVQGRLTEKLENGIQNKGNV